MSNNTLESSFIDNNKEKYLKTVEHYLKLLGKDLNKNYIKEAMEWSVSKGSFSGRTAIQFANNYNKLWKIKRDTLMD